MCVRVFSVVIHACMCLCVYVCLCDEYVHVCVFLRLTTMRAGMLRVSLCMCSACAYVHMCVCVCLCLLGFLNRFLIFKSYSRGDVGRGRGWKLNRGFTFLLSFIIFYTKSNICSEIVSALPDSLSLSPSLTDIRTIFLVFFLFSNDL